jgi:hypothetical protein
MQSTRLASQFFTVALVLGFTSSALGDPLELSARQRGVSWVGGHEPIGLEHLRPLADAHVNWIVQTPFGWQQRYDAPGLQLATGGRILWGERDEGLRTTHRLAQSLGIQTLLKPHIWLRDRSGGKWRTDIRMNSEEDWQRWFADYRTFILHYARLAEAEGMGALAVGTELHRTTVEREQDWRRLIAEIRKVYGGSLTYAANWWREYEEIRFWDALDFIGIQAYFPLTDQQNPTLEALEQGWETYLKSIEAISKRFDKPVVFTEIGYKSTPDAAVKPWEWPQPSAVPLRPPAVDPMVQARCYEAFFQAVWDKPWFLGSYFWKWYPARSGERDPDNIDFTPQGKPAEKVLSRWYGSKAPQPVVRSTPSGSPP